MNLATAAPATRSTLRHTSGATCLAAVVSVGVNTLLALGALAGFRIPPTFEPLDLGSVAVASVVGALGAGLCFALAGWVAGRNGSGPVPVFLVVVAVLLVASMYPPIALLVSDPPQYPGTSVLAVLTLMLMHIVVAAVSVVLLVPELRRRRRSR